MEDDLKRLIDICPPPNSPIENGWINDWQWIETEAGLKLPPDYQQFINLYGTGTFADLLSPLNPFCQHHYNLIAENQKWLTANREIRREFLHVFPFPIFPEPAGLYLWGFTHNGDKLYWQTTGEPANWPVIIYESRSPEYQRFDTTMTGFLAGWLSGELDCKIFPDRNEYFEAIFEQPQEWAFLNIGIRYLALSYEERLQQVMNLFGAKKIKAKHVAEKGYGQCIFTTQQLNASFTYNDNRHYGSGLSIAYSPNIETELKIYIQKIIDQLGWAIWLITRNDGTEIWSELKNSQPPITP